MSEPADKQDLDFEARLEAAKAKHNPYARQVAATALAQGTRHAVEIAATTLVGGGIGWMLDTWLGTKPWMLLLFFFFGVSAGFWNLFKMVAKEAEAVKKAADEQMNDDQG